MYPESGDNWMISYMMHMDPLGYEICILIVFCYFLGFNRCKSTYLKVASSEMFGQIDLHST